MRILLLLLLAALPAYARLGDTQHQLEARYGSPKKPGSPTASLLKGATEVSYEHQGWRIRCALLKATDGRYYTVREEYRKIYNADVVKAGGKLQIQDSERDSVLAAEEGSRKWRQQNLAGTDASKNKVWVRDDGATAQLDAGNTVMRFNLPQALKYEAELKKLKEGTMKPTVPKF